jgi:hypothetical protein
MTVDLEQHKGRAKTSRIPIKIVPALSCHVAALV